MHIFRPWKPDVPIWDAHMHVHRLPGHRWDSPPERAIALMDAAGIAKAAIMPYSEIDFDSVEMLEEGATIAREFPDRFLLFARLHPGSGAGAGELLDRAVEMGYVGLKLHPVGSRIHPTDTRTVDLVRRAADLGLPTLFHCGDEELTLPGDIGPLAEKVPEATIILGHAGGYAHVRQAMVWAERCPNIVLELSATPHLLELRRGLDRLGPERFIFGSDGPGCLPQIDLIKTRALLQGGFEKSAGDVLRNNFARLLPGGMP